MLAKSNEIKTYKSNSPLMAQETTFGDTTKGDRISFLVLEKNYI